MRGHILSSSNSRVVTGNSKAEGSNPVGGLLFRIGCFNSHRSGGSSLGFRDSSL